MSKEYPLELGPYKVAVYDVFQRKAMQPSRKGSPFSPPIHRRRPFQGKPLTRADKPRQGAIIGSRFILNSAEIY